MEDDTIVNPWIEVPKRKRHRTFNQNDPSQITLSSKSEVENLQTNSFISLTLQESRPEDSTSNGTEMTVETAHRPPSPGLTSPPRKRSKKDPTKKSHYPSIKVREDAINRQVGLIDFRDLILWMLDDSSPPEWIEVRHKSYVRACVVVYVPGLSPEIFNIEPTRGSEGKRMRRLDELESVPLPHLADIFKYLWLPKAPGTNNQLFSPVSSFLNVPLTASQNHQRAREQSKQKGQMDIETLLMNPVEMRNAGYPPHPLHEDGFSDLDTVYTPYVAQPSGNRKTVIGMDCEMCLTEAGSEITRVTLVDFQGNTLFDELVKPENPITDYLTTWSGITEERLLNTTTTLASIQASLVKIIDSDTILVGHSLECDLQALKLAHPHVIDTSVIYQHSRGPPYKPSLKWLANKWLKRKIQANVAGHDSAEDAKTAIDLVKLKCQKGKEFGLFNVDMESLFTRCKRKGVDSAVVEYGDRGTAFYGDKVRTCISVESDSEVVDGVLGSLETSHGFIWARMKEVETAAKWKDYDSVVTSHAEMAPVLEKFDINIQRLWDGLSPCTALMVVTGSGDPREMSRLFAKRKLYEEQTKSGNNVQVQWTDADQQAYTFAVDKARTGLGFVAIK